MDKDEGMVIDLAEKVESGKLTPEEAKEEVLKRGLRHTSYELKYTNAIVLFMTTGVILCFLPLITKLTGPNSLRVFTQHHSIIFPPTVIYVTIAITVIVNALCIHAMYLRIKKGGTCSEDEPIILIKEGPYAIMRHTILGLALLLPLVTVAASKEIPFTFLSVVGNIFFLAAFYYITKGEDELNVLKWGDEYRRYMKEVPRFNFILGAWRWVNKKRKKSGEKIKNAEKKEGIRSYFLAMPRAPPIIPRIKPMIKPPVVKKRLRMEKIITRMPPMVSFPGM